MVLRGLVIALITLFWYFGDTGDLGAEGCYSGIWIFRHRNSSWLGGS